MNIIKCSKMFIASSMLIGAVFMPGYAGDTVRVEVKNLTAYNVGSDGVSSSNCMQDMSGISNQVANKNNGGNINGTAETDAGFFDGCSTEHSSFDLPFSVQPPKGGTSGGQIFTLNWYKGAGSDPTASIPTQSEAEKKLSNEFNIAPPLKCGNNWYVKIILYKTTDDAPSCSTF